MKNRQKIYKKILQKSNKNFQYLIALEELGELIQAITKRIRYKDKKYVKNLLEEVVDVEIMLEQIKYFEDFSEKDINEIKEYKLKRVLEKIKLVKI